MIWGKNMRKTKRVVCPGVQKTKKQKSLAIHLIVDFYFPKNFKEDPKEIEKVLYQASLAANNKPIKYTFHKFNPHGMSAVYLLAESHISIHSWPEFNYLAIDIFNCGKKAKPEKALAFLKKYFKPKKVIVKKIERGF
jgi:S-adenosylmethionine decarboxylase